MRLPRSFDVFGKLVPIEYVKDLDAHGYYDYEDEKIEIRKGLRGELLLRTLIHELAHAWLHRTGVHYVLPKKIEEVLCHGLEAIMVENFDIKPKI